MSPDQSMMFSDAMYLFGNTFPSIPSRRDSEELPDLTRISQKILAVQVVLAAFAYLYQKQLIAFVLDERKFLFIRNKTIYVKTRQSTAPDLSGVEAILFSTLRVESNMYDITGRLIPHSYNPWDEVLHIVKEHLVQRGLVKREVRPGLFIKYVVIGDISKGAKQVIELQKTLEELQAKGELYEHMLSAIRNGIASREVTGLAYD